MSSISQSRLSLWLTRCAVVAASLAFVQAASAQSAFESGPYIGLGLGYGKMSDQLTWRAKAGQGVDRNTERESARKSGLVGGAFIGYNWRFDRFLLGIEADISTGSLKHRYYSSERDADGDYNEHFNHKMSWFASIRPRAGYLVSDSVLLYGTVGFATARMKTSYGGNYTDFVDPNESFSFSANVGTRQVHGWTAGAGLEWAVSDRLHVRAEYLYTRFQRKKFTMRASTSDGEVVHHRAWIKPKLNQFRVGVSYHF